MATTITAGEASSTPTLVLTMEYEAPVRDIAHAVLDRSDSDVTLRPMGLRTGSLELFYADHGEALSALELLRTSSVLTLTNDVDPWKSMVFVKQQRLALRREGQHARWVVTTGFLEVLT